MTEIISAAVLAFFGVLIIVLAIVTSGDLAVYIVGALLLIAGVLGIVFYIYPSLKEKTVTFFQKVVSKIFPNKKKQEEEETEEIENTPQEESASEDSTTEEGQ